jgi:hypothetical protein
MGFGLPFAAIAAGYGCTAIIRWSGRRPPAGRLAAGAACGCLLVAILITGRIQTVQFRGPSTTVATQLVSTISHGYKPGTYILSDGAARMEQYYLPRIPFHSWLGIFDPTPATQAAYENRICSHAVSLVILRLSHKRYDHPYDSRVEKLLGRTRKYRLAITAGQGNYATQVWQLEPGSARGSCR